MSLHPCTPMAEGRVGREGLPTASPSWGWWPGFLQPPLSRTRPGPQVLRPLTPPSHKTQPPPMPVSTYLRSLLPGLPGKPVQASLPLEEGGKGRNEEQTDVPRADVMKRDGRQRPSVSHCPQLHSPPSTFRSGWATHTHTHTPLAFKCTGGQGAEVKAKGQRNQVPISASHFPNL